MIQYSGAVEEAVDAISALLPDIPSKAFVFGETVDTYEDLNTLQRPVSPGDVTQGPSSLQDIGAFSVGSIQRVPFFFLKMVDYRPGEFSLMEETLPLRVLGCAGVHTLIVVNTCLGLEPSYRAGGLCLIVDHINFQGDSPLIGANVDAWGPRFPDMTEPYDPELRALSETAARSLDLTLHQSVFASVGPGDLDEEATHFLHRSGAHCVGRGLVNEVIVARHMGIRVLGISVVQESVSSSEPDLSDQDLNQAVMPRLMTLINTIAPKL